MHILPAAARYAPIICVRFFRAEREKTAHLQSQVPLEGSHGSERRASLDRNGAAGVGIRLCPEATEITTQQQIPTAAQNLATFQVCDHCASQARVAWRSRCID